MIQDDFLIKLFEHGAFTLTQRASTLREKTQCLAYRTTTRRPCEPPRIRTTPRFNKSATTAAVSSSLRANCDTILTTSCSVSFCLCLAFMGHLPFPLTPSPAISFQEISRPNRATGFRLRLPRHSRYRLALRKRLEVELLPAHAGLEHQPVVRDGEDHRALLILRVQNSAIGGRHGAQ